ncbi:helix-turn-helix domain-containing protein [Wenxinia marina]|uniref:Helix-turn-helix domain protein n=1 Tax=Wenxinia marina DSM 24838 TaxID=1123501 RepID=A0A0D0P9R3_9RHOB|nr:helix-turn-helix transcriptional regulator [Wenxinia marina]KIQ68246.1 Helix-turn-helix domain protein [Wenxinia marina DSM 24838]GGL77067.1 transcriptional regulator [Wenxinia marina]
MSEFSANLALACGHYRSISEVCRRMGINRQQFNKYLSGGAYPSRHNMRRICDFFGVTESEMLMDEARFERLIGLRRAPQAPSRLDLPLRHIEKVLAHASPVDRYAGYYFRYFYSFGNKGYVIRSLLRVVIREGRGYFKNLEILHDPATGRWTRTNKYEGILFQLADRLQAFEYETVATNSVTQMTLYPVYRSRLDVIVGIQTGGPTRRGRRPGASRVALEYLGADIDLRKGLRQTGLFRPDDPALRRDIVAAIDNRMTGDSCVLDIEEP